MRGLRFERLRRPDSLSRRGSAYRGTVLDGKTQAINHLPNQPWTR
ncbi:enoyl-CoA hydratase/isomerase domain protein [Mycobacterium xenopi 4042]|uniref:Enoyl-CoA hydratase/isomerase domain protein n=1 Tax=Mycobacterium xenopi 4042 TaxID=1299334 RepID=X7YKF0_MYCXE|nr:enoyl-CoA hydratase/isomerase domain protein [Mycobacterium xenopi 4042]